MEQMYIDVSIAQTKKDLHCKSITFRNGRVVVVEHGEVVKDIHPQHEDDEEIVTKYVYQVCIVGEDTFIVDEFDNINEANDCMKICLTNDPDTHLYIRRVDRKVEKYMYEVFENSPSSFGYNIPLAEFNCRNEAEAYAFQLMEEKRDNVIRSREYMKDDFSGDDNEWSIKDEISDTSYEVVRRVYKYNDDETLNWTEKITVVEEYGSWNIDCYD